MSRKPHEETDKHRVMSPEEEIDAVIDAGWCVVESDFSEVAFAKWRKAALKCLALLCGANHPYTHYFKSVMFKTEVRNVLAGVGVLEAAGSGSFAPRALEHCTEPVDRWH